jgi:FkbM family methyltransferase
MLSSEAMMQLAQKSAFSVALDRIGRGGLTLLRRWRAKDARGKFFLLPEDYIGSTIIAEGAFEKGYLASLDTLIDRARAKGLMEGGRLAAIDIGANIGTHTVYLSGKFQRVHSFEPNPMIHHVLSANIALNKLDGVTAHRVALSDNDEVLTYAQDTSGNLGGSCFSRDANAKGVAMELKRADRFIFDELAPGERVAFVKIDVEGLEDKVVAGLADLLARDKPLVICEIAGAERGRKVAATLKSAGYPFLYEIHNPARYGAGGGLARTLKALMSGVGYDLAALADFEDRIYPMIVGSPADLLA